MAPTIFGRRRSLSGYADGVALFDLKQAAFFQADFKLPLIIIIVGVTEFFFRTEIETIKTNLEGIIHETESTAMLNTVTFAANQKVVEMTIFPVHHDLQAVMQVSNGAVATHPQAPPNHRADLPQVNPQLIHLNRFYRVCHGLIKKKWLNLPWLFPQSIQISGTGNNILSALQVGVGDNDRAD